MKQIAIVIVLLSSILIAQDTRSRRDSDDVSENPYVQLYEHRVTIARNDVEKHKAILADFMARKTRAERLYGSKALSEEEVQMIRAETQVAMIGVKSAEVRVKEAEALWAVSKMRISAGLDMPICSRN